MINITLRLNKACQIDCPDELKTLGSDLLVISGEAGVTQFHVCYPETMKEWAKRVEIVNAKGEYENIEFEGYEVPLEGNLEFDFSLPSSATKYNGYAKLLFKATKGKCVFIWKPEPIPVTGEVWSSVPATGNQDLLSAAYETAQAANSKSDSALLKAVEAGSSSIRAETTAGDALSKMNALVQEPDCTEANGEGEARVEITSDGRLKFVNVKGFMPVIQVGDVQTVPPEGRAEVVIRQGSDPRNPIIDMKLPAGRPGEKGESVSAGMQSISVHIDDWQFDEEQGYKLFIPPNKHGLGATNKIIVDVNPYAGTDGTVYNTYDSSTKAIDGTITITAHAPWEGMVYCAAGIAEGQDIVARQEISTHKADAAAHVTAVERGDWNAKETPAGAQTRADKAQQAAKSYTDNKIAELVGAAPDMLDTLEEISNALANDPNHTEVMLAEISQKADKTTVEQLQENIEIFKTATTEKFDTKKNINANDVQVFDIRNAGYENKVKLPNEYGSYHAAYEFISGTQLQIHNSSVDWFTVTTLKGWDNNYGMVQIATPSSNSAGDLTEMHIRYGNLTQWHPWQRVLTNQSKAKDIKALTDGTIDVTWAQLNDWNYVMPNGTYTCRDGQIPLTQFFNIISLGNYNTVINAGRTQIAVDFTYANEGKQKMWKRSGLANTWSAWQEIGSGIISSKTEFRDILFAYRYATAGNSPALFFDKPGAGLYGIGSNGEADTMQFGRTDNYEWDSTQNYKSKFLGELYEGNARVYSPNNPPPIASSAPYKYTITSWSGVMGNYTYVVQSSTHGKGIDPIVEMFDTNGNRMYDDYNIDSTGNITFKAASNIMLVVKIRS